MATERTACPRCRKRFARVVGTRRKYCEQCSPPRRPPASAAPPAPVERPPGPVESRARIELERAGRLDTVEGLVLVNLARRLDDPATTGSQAASVARELREASRAALAGTVSSVDPLDQLEARRRERAASA